MTDLLARIVASRNLQPEPVATDALVHLCSTSKAAASVMADLLVELCPGASTPGLMFTGQDIHPDSEGRPDLVASDPAGARLVVEAKFDAELTAAQTSGAYVGKLSTVVPSALVFLVPRDRMKNLWRVVSVTPGGALAPADLVEGAVDEGAASMPVGDTGRVLAVLSWEALLNRLDSAMANHGDTDGAAEVAQLRGLVEWRTTVGWVPLVPDDLPQRVGRQLHAIGEVLKSVCTEASTGKTRNGSGDGGFGRYLTTPTGKSIWVGIWMRWWDRRGPGPAWAQVKVKTPAETSLTSQALTKAGIEHQVRSERCDTLIPLHLPLGAEKGATEEHLLAQVEAVIAAVDGLAVEAVEDDAEEVNEGAEALPVD